jgi:hypothetical protein
MSGSAKLDNPPFRPHVFPHAICPRGHRGAEKACACLVLSSNSIQLQASGLVHSVVLCKPLSGPAAGMSVVSYLRPRAYGLSSERVDLEAMSPFRSWEGERNLLLCRRVRLDCRRVGSLPALHHELGLIAEVRWPNLGNGSLEAERH